MIALNKELSLDPNGPTRRLSSNNLQSQHFSFVPGGDIADLAFISIDVEQ